MSPQSHLHCPPFLSSPPLGLPSDSPSWKCLLNLTGRSQEPKKEHTLTLAPTSLWCDLPLVLPGTIGPLCAPERFVSCQTMKALLNTFTPLSTEAMTGHLHEPLAPTWICPRSHVLLTFDQAVTTASHPLPFSNPSL